MAVGANLTTVLPYLTFGGVPIYIANIIGSIGSVLSYRLEKNGEAMAILESPDDSIFIGDYLTTAGQEGTKDHQMLRDLGFEIDNESSEVPV